ncbi:MAG: DUF1697 domain-containing protein [Kiloniellales bacterium]
MTVHIALLRAVNVGGRNKIAMSELRALAGALGLADARTLLQSGNLVFRSGRASSALERQLEEETARRLGVSTDYLVRSAAEWETAIARNPFPDEAKRDPSRLLVVFLKEAPERTSVKALQAAITGPEVVGAAGKQAYIIYPAGIGRSKLTSALIEGKLGTRGTARNWNSVLKLAALAGV